LEEGVPERVAPTVFRIPQRRKFPGEQTVRFLLQRYFKYAEHLRKPFFPLQQYYIHAEHHVGVMFGTFFNQSCLTANCKTFDLTLNKSAKLPLRLLSMFYFPQSKILYRQSTNCSLENPSLFVNPGLKHTRMDAILKKFD
jgi:hypothetical protein